MICLIFATIREAKPFIKKAGISINSKIVYPFFYECNIAKKKIILSISGIGISRARACTVELIERHTVRHVYNIGICGTVKDTFNINDLYCVSEALYWQCGTRHTFPCKPEFFDKKKHGILATCTKPVFDSELKKKIAMRADIVDMEGAAIAEICHRNSIACTLLKGVSDGADNGDRKILFENIDLLSKRMTTLVWNNLFKDR